MKVPYRCRMRHPAWSATDVTVHAIDGTTALVSDNAQMVRRGGVMRRVLDVPGASPSRWWVSTSALLEAPPASP